MILLTQVLIPQNSAKVIFTFDVSAFIAVFYDKTQNVVKRPSFGACV